MLRIRIRCFFTPRSEIRDRFYVKSRYHSLSTGSSFLLYLYKINNSIYNFVKFVGTKKLKQSPLLLFLLDPGWIKIRSGIRDGINIPDPQHCKSDSATLLRPPINIHY
jgi:hypothetical protein